MIAVAVVFFAILSLFMVGVIHRIDNVYKLRIQMLDEVHALAQDDIRANKVWQWRWDEWDKVSFNSMVLKLWKPLEPEEFWKDTRFLKP